MTTNPPNAEPNVPPGWYTDPFGRFSHRYFDGAQWTDQVARDGVTAVDPPEWPSAEPGPPTATAYGGYPAPMPYGAPVPMYAAPGAKSRLAAGLLGIFLGWLGIHRFYLGYNGLGLTMLLLSVLSIGLLAPFIAIWGLVEGIMILAGAEKFRTDARGVPLTN
jgi:TM2 domain-containing membrane protein YozV